MTFIKFFPPRMKKMNRIPLKKNRVSGFFYASFLFSSIFRFLTLMDKEAGMEEGSLFKMVTVL